MSTSTKIGRSDPRFSFLPGSRPAGAGDILAAAAGRADRAQVSAPRSRLWWSDELGGAVESILKLRDRGATILPLTDIMLLMRGVLA